jgi:hypothetical protein
MFSTSLAIVLCTLSGWQLSLLDSTAHCTAHCSIRTRRRMSFLQCAGDTFLAAHEEHEPGQEERYTQLNYSTVVPMKCCTLIACGLALCSFASMWRAQHLQDLGACAALRWGVQTLPRYNSASSHSVRGNLSNNTGTRTHARTRLQPVVLALAIVECVIVVVQLMFGSRTAFSTWCDGADLCENTALNDNHCARRSIGFGHRLEANSVQLGRYSFAPTTASVLRHIPSRRQGSLAVQYHRRQHRNDVTATNGWHALHTVAVRSN